MICRERKWEEISVGVEAEANQHCLISIPRVIISHFKRISRHGLVNRDLVDQCSEHGLIESGLRKDYLWLDEIKAILYNPIVVQQSSIAGRILLSCLVFSTE